MMKNDAAPSPSEQEKKKEQSIGRRLLNALIHNWGWKVASLALAVCLWGVLITQDTSLPRTKTIEGVRVGVEEVGTSSISIACPITKGSRWHFTTAVSFALYLSEEERGSENSTSANWRL